MADWLKRPFDDDRDGDGLRYMLGVSYCRTRAGRRAGASRAGGSIPEEEVSDEVARARQRAFLDAHRPIWSWLFGHADITIACDPEDPNIIWGWLLTSGDEVVHAVGVKRSFTERKHGLTPVSVELVADLLGERLKKHQVCTLELPQMRANGTGTIGLDRPAKWSLDPTWLLSRMVSR